MAIILQPGSVFSTQSTSISAFIVDTLIVSSWVMRRATPFSLSCGICGPRRCRPSWHKRPSAGQFSAPGKGGLSRSFLFAAHLKLWQTIHCSFLLRSFIFSFKPFRFWFYYPARHWTICCLGSKGRKSHPLEINWSASFAGLLLWFLIRFLLLFLTRCLRPVLVNYYRLLES